MDLKFLQLVQIQWCLVMRGLMIGRSQPYLFEIIALCTYFCV